MTKREPVEIPKVALYKDSFNGTVYSGSFGDFPLYNIEDADKPLNDFFGFSF